MYILSLYSLEKEKKIKSTYILFLVCLLSFSAKDVQDLLLNIYICLLPVWKFSFKSYDALKCLGRY